MKVLPWVVILLVVVEVVPLDEGSKVACNSNERAQWRKVILSYPYECFDTQFLLDVLTCYNQPRNISYGEGINECLTKSYTFSGVGCRSDCVELLNELTYMAARKYDFRCQNQKFLESVFKCIWNIRQGAECPQVGYSSCTKPFK